MIEVLEHNLKQYATEIQFYESKYKMNIDEFLKKVSEIKDKGIIEKEDDWMEWDSANHSFNYYKKQIEKVKMCLS